MLVLAAAAAALAATPDNGYGVRSEPVDLVCRDQACSPGRASPIMRAGSFAGASSELGKRAFQLPPLGEVAPSGWLLHQLILQANSLSGFMATSTFPGAINVNQSLWVGGDYKTSTLQWLPYWTNGNVPLVELIKAAGAQASMDPQARLSQVVDGYVDYILSHTNRSSGWIGPFANEPGDINGHGLWDPLNMLRTLLNYAQAHPERESEITKACVAHMTKEGELLKTDPVYKWAQTRWPTFVEIALYIIDELVPVYGSSADIMPLGAEGTTQMLLDASALFATKGMDWGGYYHRTGSIKFPLGPVPNWNTNDHGVNNAEGALRYPAVAYRLQNNDTYRNEMNFVLGMLDKYQGQVQALFCADEVFCGREPHRGTETCAVVEAMASLEYAFTTLGDPLLMDRVERLAFNAMPAALTADMWTHVYVQQPNSVFAGNTHPTTESSPTSTGLDAGGCARCGGYSASPDTPSGEDMNSNFYGVSHFPCCITNFPQGWPKFAMHAIVAETDGSGVVVSSLVPSQAHIKSVGATVITDSNYPFGDTATITVTATRPISLKVRIPGWADGASVDASPVPNGTFFAKQCPIGKTIVRVVLNTTPRFETGWGGLGSLSGAAVTYTDGKRVPVPSATPDDDLIFSGGAAYETRTKGHDSSLRGIRSGTPNSQSKVVLAHPIVGNGHILDTVTFTFMYTAGYTPSTGQSKKASTLELAVFDYLNGTKVASVYQSPPLGNYSYDNFTSYSPPIIVSESGLGISNSRPLELALVFSNNDRNLELAFHGDLGFHVGWSIKRSSEPVVPVPKYRDAPENSAAVLFGPLVMAHHPHEAATVVKTYSEDLPARPRAVDYEITTNQTWSYALNLSTSPIASRKPSHGWSPLQPFSTTEYPLSITVDARLVPDWGFWEGSKITDSPPASPIDCRASTKPMCGDRTQLTLVPFGGTNIRIAVFPWFE